MIGTKGDKPSKGTCDLCYLVLNHWDDFGFRTTYEVTVYDEDGKKYELGSTRIMFKGQDSSLEHSTPSESGFADNFCSLGSERRYYILMKTMSPATQAKILIGLRDCAFDHKIYERFKNEDAFKVSLLRSATEQDVLIHYPRILSGQKALTSFSFSYILSPSVPENIANVAMVGIDPQAEDAPPLLLRFSVRPGSKPPSNVHVLIGRNGVGKTRVLAGMADALTDNKASSFGLAGRFEFNLDDSVETGDFLNLVIVSFSAFDRFDPIPTGSARTKKSLPFYYIGVKRPLTDKDGTPTGAIGIKSPDELNDDFRNALETICWDDERVKRWVKALETLSSDPGIRDLCAHEILDADSDIVRNRITERVSHMSSGHKIVLLTITRLIENVSDRSLVLLDEPETHLHPPLLGSFMRALSELLVDSNGVAIVATHSPVVLQEVPSKCVWQLLGSGETLKVERPNDETFAENVSVLTRKVFGLEIEQSGFYKLLSTQAKDSTYDDVEKAFHSRIGAEGRALLRALTWKVD
jgi:predicted ATPase